MGLSFVPVFTITTTVQPVDTISGLGVASFETTKKANFWQFIKSENPQIKQKEPAHNLPYNSAFND